MFAVTDVLSQAFPTQPLYLPEIIHITAVKIIASIFHLQVGCCVTRCRVPLCGL